MTPWVLRLVLANVAMFFLQSASPIVTELFAFVPAAGWYRPWTFVTYMFLHGGFGHIFFNMLSLFFFGPRLEDRLGGKHFLGLYFASGIMGALLSIPFTPNVYIIGASGAVFGVMLGFAWFWPREQMLIWGILPIESRIMVIIMTAMALFGGFTGGGGVAHYAHLGGFLGGFVYLKLLSRNAGMARFRRATQPKAPRIETTASALDRWRRIKRDDLHEVNRDELDRILDKISAEGMGGLTPGEREFLDRFSTRH
ncbi:MAG: rhomboid family intramembrane serine protease [Gemmatimonadales bacterium]|nr:rhomboid family intramembrane serine protease [Gemmatimonadales bacterium]